MKAKCGKEQAAISEDLLRGTLEQAMAGAGDRREGLSGRASQGNALLISDSETILTSTLRH